MSEKGQSTCGHLCCTHALPKSNVSGVSLDEPREPFVGRNNWNVGAVDRPSYKKLDVSAITSGHDAPRPRSLTRWYTC